MHCKFQPLVLNTYWKKKKKKKKIFQRFHPYKSIETQVWPCRKKVKSQPMIIIWTNLVELESSMLNIKIQPQSLFGSGEDLKCFYHT